MTPEGWYPDPLAERWWTGSDWSDKTRLQGTTSEDGPTAPTPHVKPPGWYQDTAIERRWDGTSWTAEVRSAALPGLSANNTPSALHSSAGESAPRAKESQRTKRGLLVLAGGALLTVTAVGTSWALGGRGNDPEANTTTTEALPAATESPTSQPGDVEMETTTTTPPASPEQLLEQRASQIGASVSTGTFSSPCGVHAALVNEEETQLLTWAGDSWRNDADDLGSWPTRGDGTNYPPISIEVSSLTPDQYPDVQIMWVPQSERDAMRDFAGLVTLSESCEWVTHTFISDCVAGPIVESLVFPSLYGSGFVGPCAGRSTFRFEWFAGPDVFVGTLADDRYDGVCPNGLEFTDRLPLFKCHEAPAVTMVQEALVSEGARIEVDGQFGPATQRALIEYQWRHDLTITGYVDEATWSDMFVLPFPDLNGDGIVGPEEIPYD